nr:radical SAM protein [Candidatus Njordarchaeum guaymaensis]
MVLVNEVTCKSVLSDSGIEPFTYSISPYVSCQHACVYCYARFMMRFRAGPEGKQWGEFVNAKVNAPTVLLREIRRKPKGVTWLSAVTDPYQPLEKKFELTRRCLEVLLNYRFPIWIQTKSSLVMRDIDLIVNFPVKDVGFTILTLDDDLRKEIEPGASPVGERVAALEELSKRGVRTFAFIGPILPLITDSQETLRPLLRDLVKAGTSQILFDRLNLRWGVWPSMKTFLEKHDPSLLQKYKEIMWHPTSYFEDLKNLIRELCKDTGAGKYEICY